MKIAIVGSGIAGLTVAAGLAGRHDVTVLEAEDWVGGHTSTVDVDEDVVVADLVDGAFEFADHG